MYQLAKLSCHYWLLGRKGCASDWPQRFCVCGQNEKLRIIDLSARVSESLSAKTKAPAIHLTFLRLHAFGENSLEMIVPIPWWKYILHITATGDFSICSPWDQSFAWLKRLNSFPFWETEKMPLQSFRNEACPLYYDSPINCTPPWLYFDVHC